MSRPDDVSRRCVENKTRADRPVNASLEVEQDFQKNLIAFIQETLVYHAHPQVLRDVMKARDYEIGIPEDEFWDDE